MSYDIYLQIDTGNPEGLADVLEVGNYTGNVSGMWAKALGVSLRELNGSKCADAVSLLESGVSHMRNPANQAEYREMNPKNGWGDSEGATIYLERLLEGCRKHPKCTIYVSS